MMTGWQSGGSFTDPSEDAGQDLQTRIRLLEEWVCALLIKNQTLRMGLEPEDSTPEACSYGLGAGRTLKRSTISGQISLEI